MMTSLKQIYIYSDSPSSSLSISEIIDSLRAYGFRVEHRGNLFEFAALTQEAARDTAKKIAGVRVLDISEPLDEIREPIYGEIGVELKRLEGDASSHGVLYDGLWLQRILYTVMARRASEEFLSGFAHLIFTARLFGTYEERRYHARAVLLGQPSLISTSGIVEAPARPKDYYWLKAGFIRSGKDIHELDLLYKGKFIEYDDARITQVLKSYALQSVFYELTGDAFCVDPSCCLYNSHWQEEVLKLQLDGRLCEEHRDIVKKFNSDNL